MNEIQTLRYKAKELRQKAADAIKQAELMELKADEAEKAIKDGQSAQSQTYL